MAVVEQSNAHNGSSIVKGSYKYGFPEGLSSVNNDEDGIQTPISRLKISSLPMGEIYAE